ncbi:MAG: pseudaminic acid cytidylyltransferase [Pseudomonadota bacterium]|uniref:pseudaminic acid cytidylyltransferase n=1 Tax=Marisediminitalea sp. TaxID=2662268 RepID=UPI000C634580|nr:pseudaminic acid cytidylyltransferase [Alteromonadaceae bacterium]MEC7470967.1 pseudaminic acid cytidylyltransferase [Pseudomonadota bacterium]HBY37841.1 pseudaminic acid cytidylyltransferase [Alteromonas sp.]MAX43520.1 pseudaminic acid cytidylyltransferase [Alteromonadaceae bacterium]MEC7823644.1 pseudaminic acid cytidylyltransferase [Pseudomonadota bacterium]
MKIAVIPARGGSKRISGKNIKTFAGKPLIAYSLAAANASGLFDDIVVSTDSDDIAQVARDYGATQIIKRPESLSNDIVGTFPVVQHAIETYQQSVQQVEHVCCIYATAPFLQAQKLIEGYQRLSQATDKHFAFSVTTFPFPIQRAIRLKGEGVEPLDHSQMTKRSQDLEECYHDAGQFYWGTTQAYLSNQPMFAPHSIPVVLPRHLVQDIDTPEDWERAELMYRAYVAG